MDFGANKTPIEVILTFLNLFLQVKAHLEEQILETFILVLMESSTEIHGETLLVCKNLFLFMLTFLRWQF